MGKRAEPALKFEYEALVVLCGNGVAVQVTQHMYEKRSNLLNHGIQARPGLPYIMYQKVVLIQRHRYKASRDTTFLSTTTKQAITRSSDGESNRRNRHSDNRNIKKIEKRDNDVQDLIYRIKPAQ